MKVHTKHPKIYLAVFLFAALTFFQTGCQKSGLEEIQTDPALEQKFFSGSESLDPSVQRLVAKMRVDLRQPGYIAQFVKVNGYPIWNKNFKANNKDENGTASFSDDPKDSIIIIPVVKEKENMVNAYIVARAYDSVAIAVKHAYEYAKQPFGDERDVINEAEKMR